MWWCSDQNRLARTTLAAAVLAVGSPLIGACFHPDTDHPWNCGPNGECPGDQVCNAQQMCEDPGSIGVGSGSGIGSGSGGGSNSAPVCYGTFLKICFDAAPTAPFMTTNASTVNTDTSALCAKLVSGGDYCVIAATTISIGGTLQASGKKPLVLLATDTITTSAAIDVSSRKAASPSPEVIGAGADRTTCDSGIKPVPGGGGGGAGGSFMGDGGLGGVGTTANVATGGVSGQPSAATPTDLRGGCPAQDGDGGAPGKGGHGGGAVFLLAVNSITIGGDILAGGEGGAGGAPMLSGGGGGGSGGMIGFESPAITVMGNHIMVANGGAGGGASTKTFGGKNGDDATTTNTAQGGAGSRSGNMQLGGNGGDGSGQNANDVGNSGRDGQVNNIDGGGGGGGGGGAGIILAPNNANLGTQISPAKTPY